MSKKIALIIIILLFVIGLGFIGYYFWNQKNPAEDPSFNGGITNPFGNFFPIEEGNNAAGENVDGADNFPENLNSPVPKLRKISEAPVAGAAIFSNIKTSNETFINEEGEEENVVFSETFFRYVERATGHVFETKSTSLTSERLSNVTIPKINEAIFLKNPNNIVFRYLDGGDNIETYFARLTKDDVVEEPAEGADEFEPPEEKKPLEGYFLARNLFDFDESPDGTDIFTLRLNPTVNSESRILGSLSPAETPADSEIIFNHPMSEWEATWVDNETIALNTKPSAFSLGFLYLLDTRTGNFSKALGGINALSTKISPNGEKIIYSGNIGGRIVTRVYEVGSGSTANLDFSSFAEKCVWTNDSSSFYCASSLGIANANYPDDWYMGRVSFNDAIIKVNAGSLNSETILLPGQETKEQLDITKLQISERGDFLMFTNKKDLSLWSLDVQ